LTLWSCAPRADHAGQAICVCHKGYDYRDAERAVRSRGIVPHIRRRGENALLGCVRGKARRWVVERTNSWHNRFRGLLVRWERKAEHYLAMLQLACGLIAYRQATRR
jgi:IS5 family transposase